MPKTLHEIPRERPATPLLDRASSPAELRRLGEADLETLADELRQYLLYTVGQTGGHFGAGLGVVELTIALHYVFDTPDDRLVWDVGHQAYPHKILTERRELMGTLRQKNGLAAFPRRAESEYDTFGVGHSSTSISAALGMAIAARLQGKERKSVAVIGDGALTAGMAFEALNHASEVDADMLVILNDNDMSISHNVGGLSNYLAKILSSRTYSSMREGSKKVLSRLPGAWGDRPAHRGIRQGHAGPRHPVRGARLELHRPDRRPRPADPGGYPAQHARHEGPAVPPCGDQERQGLRPGRTGSDRLPRDHRLEAPGSAPKKTGGPKYSSVFGQWLCDMAAQDARLLGITPAMKEGSDLVAFSERYPERYFDVAIAEQHAVTLAAGMACEGMKPVVAIYSTFLQRAYDQLIHDVAVQHLDVLFAIDRAGLVGEDGPTHAGSFDISLPALHPRHAGDDPQRRGRAAQAAHHRLPVRWPGRGALSARQRPQPSDRSGPATGGDRQGRGPSARRQGRTAGLRRAVGGGDEGRRKPRRHGRRHAFRQTPRRSLVRELAGSHELLVTIEENAVMGGAGSAVGEFLASEGLEVPLLQLGLPDYYVEHAKPSEMLAECGLDAAGIEKAVRQRLDRQ